MKWILAILILGLLIAFHELGHFLLAKLSGVGVEEFSIGFGPRLLTTLKNGTRYSLKALPLGGSCRMKGEFGDESEEVYGPSTANGEAFQKVSVGKRAAIIVAGPLFNFLLAFVLAVIITSVIGSDPPTVLMVEEGSPAQAAGLVEGDRVTSFMGHPVFVGRDVQIYLDLYGIPDKDIRMTVKHSSGEKEDLVFTPEAEQRYMLGITYSPGEGPAEILSVMTGSSVQEAGLLAGDVITSIDGTKIDSSEELSEYLDRNPLSEDARTLTYERNGRSHEVVIAPTVRKVTNEGFYINLYREKTSAPKVLYYSFHEVRYWISTVIRSIGLLFNGTFSVNDLSGPIGIVDIVGDTYEESRQEGVLMTWMNMFYLIILLSANLGVMNLLPIPGLDGGRLIFLVIEGIRGKPINKKVESSIQLVVMVLLILLMIYVMYHDLMRMLF